MKTITKITLSCLFILASVQLFAQELDIKVEIIGKGSPIVFLPGYTCPGEVWTDIVTPLANEHECHLITYPGFNGVAAPDTMWYQTVTDLLEKYISNNFEEKPIIIGHSVGGLFAMQLAINNSDICSRLILVDALSAMAAVMMPGVPLENISSDSPYSKSILAMNDEQFSGMAIQMASFMTKNEEKKTLIADWMQEADRKTYVHGYTDILKVDIRKELSKITVPALVLAAVPMSMEQTQQIMEDQYAELSDKTMAYVENSGHFIMFDQEEWLISQVKSFLK
ncbi:alpha/beta fold hydrolase [Carboxylicivirga sp. N1Y90]|uniref:alpha/beta fold hydrolase n=1 Tax=Carboxylicivirga fragile TaxID=3417571 RepID=UPI003D34953F|nr:alpha/beta hydrolase [Marinilabiliaceae bacterium N1Y90]